MEKSGSIQKTKLTPKQKVKKALKWAGILVSIMLAFVAGFSINLDKTATEDLLIEKKANDTEYQELRAKIDESEETIAKKDDYNKNKDKYDEELKRLEDQIFENEFVVDEQEEERKETLNELDSQIKDKKAEIKDKQSELDALTQKIKETSEKPITLPSGDYTVGTDIPAGRYRVSGSSNFVVRDSYGDLCINTILDTQYGDGDYVATLESGMKAHCASKTTFTPVE